MSDDRPGVSRGRGRPMNAIDKKSEKRSETVAKFKEKHDKIRAVILDFAANRNVTL